jgi:hypothetical protein
MHDVLSSIRVLHAFFPHSLIVLLGLDRHCPIDYHADSDPGFRLSISMMRGHGDANCATAEHHQGGVAPRTDHRRQ